MACNPCEKRRREAKAKLLNQMANKKKQASGGNANKGAYLDRVKNAIKRR